MAYFAGMDVSLRSCALCIVDFKGTVLPERDCHARSNAAAKLRVIIFRSDAGPCMRYDHRRNTANRIATLKISELLVRYFANSK